MNDIKEKPLNIKKTEKQKQYLINPTTQSNFEILKRYVLRVDLKDSTASQRFILMAGYSTVLEQ